MKNTGVFSTVICPLFVFLPRAVHRTMQNCLAVGLVFALLGNVSLAQQLDSSTLQAEAAKQKAAQDSSTGQLSSAPSTSALPASTQPSSPVQNPGGQNQQSQSPRQANDKLIIPAGTKLPLGLLRPISVKSSDPVADVYLQITFPVTVGNQMVVPPGAYIQGVIQKTIPRPQGSAGPGFEMRYANLIFPTGYTVPIAGTLSVMRTTAKAFPMDGSDGRSVSTLATAGIAVPNLPRLEITSLSGMPLLSMGAFGVIPQQQLPPLPPLPPPPKNPFGNTVRNVMIGVGVATAVAVIAAFGFAHSRRNDLVLETGTPLELVLPAPLELDAEHATAAVRLYSALAASAPPQIVQPPEKPRMCYDPGSPGTPDTVIPGSPGTPDTVIPGANGMPDTVIPGAPATPPTVIPGSPGTPGGTYPCPKK